MHSKLIRTKESHFGYLIEIVKRQPWTCCLIKAYKYLVIRIINAIKITEQVFPSTNFLQQSFRTKMKTAQQIKSNASLKGRDYDAEFYAFILPSIIHLIQDDEIQLQHQQKTTNLMIPPGFGPLPPKSPTLRSANPLGSYSILYNFLEKNSTFMTMNKSI